MKKKLIELMKELNFYNRSEGIIELEDCDVEIMAEAIIKLYNLHDVVQRSELLKFADWQDKEGHIETFEWEGVRGLMKEFGIL